MAPPSYRVGNKGVTAITPVSPASPDKELPLPLLTSEPPPSALWQYSWDNRKITFLEPQAAIKDLVFSAFLSYKFPLQFGFGLGEKTQDFKRQESSDPQQVVFVQTDSEKRIIKTFDFSNNNYDMWLEIEYQNLSNQPTKVSPFLILGVLNFSDQNLGRYQDITLENSQGIVHNSASKEATFTETKWLGLRDRYFCALIEPQQRTGTAMVTKLNHRESQIGFKLNEISLGVGEKTKLKFHIYLGPQELGTLKGINPQWANLIYFGKLDFIAHLLLQLLDFIHKLVKNWGWTIVIVSLLIYFLLYPITLKQMRSMKEMQALQPRIEEIRSRNKDNPQKMNKEIMELYREHKVNPFSGCLPLLLQLPIFFALYQTLVRSVALKGANFLWIKDLSEPDRLWIFSKASKGLPIIGNELNILPLVMAVLMFLQQRNSLSSGNSAAQEQQKLMMFFMPILFAFIFYRMPSGLVLYWLINSALTFLFQVRMKPKV